MLEAVFIRLLEVSVTTSIIILGLRLLAPYLNNTYAAKWKYWIWLVLAVRLIIPFNISLPTALLAVNIPNASITTSGNLLPNPPSSDVVTVQPDATAVQPGQPLPSAQTAQRTITLLDVVAIIWLIGIVAFLVYQMAGYFIFKRKVSRWSRAPQNPRIESAIHSLSYQIGLSRRVVPLISDIVSSPLMIGFFRSLLILPCETYSDADLSFIVRHELTHCRRNDLWYKLLLIIANAVHWYNPVIYLMFREANGDLESSCDDAIINGMSFAERKVYTETILASIQRQGMKETALSTYFYGGQRTIKNRFINILNTKHKKNGALVLLTVVLAAAMVGGLVGWTTGNAEPSADATSIEETGPFVGYVKDATVDTFDVYTGKDGTYIISLPMSLFNDFPASDRTNPHWQPGWMNVDVYCGTIDDFTWAVVCTGPSAGSGNANVCTSTDGGETWRVGDKSAVHPGTVTGAGFVSSKVGFMSYRYYSDQGPEISRTLDGGKTWERMTVDVPDDLKEYKMTPLGPVFTGKSGRYPIELYDSDANFTSIVYLATADGGMTWQFDSDKMVHADNNNLTLNLTLEDFKKAKRLDEIIDKPGWEDTSLFILAELSEEDIALYGMKDKNGIYENVAIRSGEKINYYGWSYYAGKFDAGMSYQDYDGDGTKELAVHLYLGGGTGVSVDQFFMLEELRPGVFEPIQFKSNDYIAQVENIVSYRVNEKNQTISLFKEETELQNVDISWLKEEGKVKNVFYGNIVRFDLSHGIVMGILPGMQINDWASLQYDGFSELEAIVEYHSDGTFHVTNIR